jgi:hypothetical protein
MYVTPSTIFDIADREITAKGGGTLRPALRPVGGGWNIYHTAEGSPPVTILDNGDVWEACRVMNEGAI